MDLRTKICRCLTKIGSKKCVNGAWRLRTSAYTLAHKMAFSDYEKCLTGRHTLAGRLHDCDKLFLYMLPWLNKKQIQVYHHKHQPHHMEYPQYKVAHLVQSYIDWECAAVTKPDKPLDAFATLLHYYPERLPLMLPVCLAINDAGVSPYVATVNYNNKPTGMFYADAQLYDKTFNIINDVICGLKAKSDLIACGKTTLEKTLKALPNNLSQLKSDELFLKTLALIAKRRRQKINLQACINVLESKLAIFGKYQKFLTINPSYLAYATNYSLYNPFLEW